MMAARTGRGNNKNAGDCKLTHGQFEDLRRYEDQNAHYFFRAPSRPMTVNGWIARAPNSGQTRADSAFSITENGLAALAAYRSRWGVKVADGG